MPARRPLGPPSMASATPPATHPRPSPRSERTLTYLSLVVECGRPLMKLKSRRSIPAGAGGATTTATLPDSTLTATGPASTIVSAAFASPTFGGTPPGRPDGFLADGAMGDLSRRCGRERQGDRIGRDPAASVLIETVEAELRDVRHRRAAGERQVGGDHRDRRAPHHAVAACGGDDDTVDVIALSRHCGSEDRLVVGSEVDSRCP